MEKAGGQLVNPSLPMEAWSLWNRVEEMGKRVFLSFLGTGREFLGI